MDWLVTVGTLLILPFWFLMIVLPTWGWTGRVLASSWVLVPLPVLYTLLLFMNLDGFLAIVTDPRLATLAGILGQPGGAATCWLHLLALDFFVGRWQYLDGRTRGLSPWLASPILALTLLAGPLGLLAYLALRASQQPPPAP